MKNIYLNNAGDGLCLGLSDVFGNTIQIDWGSAQGYRNAIETWKRMMKQPCFQPHGSPDVFILSHFHSDHFNGLMRAANGAGGTRCKTNIRQVFYPGQPKFPESKKFYNALLAVSLLTIGEESGYMGVDLTDAVRKLNGYPPSSKTLFEDMEFSLGNFDVECLWPPRQYDNVNFTKVVETALKAFDEALEENHLLREIYEKVIEKNIFKRMDSRAEGNRQNWNEEHELEISSHNLRIEDSEKGIDKNPFLPNINSQNYRSQGEAFKNANEKLRKAANRLCLVLMVNKNFLFWGDLEAREIGIVAKNLVERNCIDFDVMIAPHHGTHWHDNLMKLRTKYMLVPNGVQMNAKFKANLNKISNRLLSTYSSRDIRLNSKEI